MWLKIQVICFLSNFKKSIKKDKYILIIFSPDLINNLSIHSLLTILWKKISYNVMNSKSSILAKTTILYNLSNKQSTLSTSINKYRIQVGYENKSFWNSEIIKYYERGNITVKLQLLFCIREYQKVVWHVVCCHGNTVILNNKHLKQNIK